MKRTPEEWLAQPEYKGLIILDPDGWDRKNFEESWAEPITQEVFIRRVMISICIFPENFFQSYKCRECDIYPVDRPDGLCEGCHAYRDHTGYY